MPGQPRQPSPRPPAGEGAVDRDAAIEALLLKGLDLYFSGHYERAVQAWTRVLFLDRGHTRARAYIDRARRVLAERQRESDELLHGGVAAFDAGDVDKARALLTTLLDRGSVDDLALALLERLDRLEGAAGAAPYLLPAAEAAPPPSNTPAGQDLRRGRATRVLAITSGVFLAGAVLLAAFWDRFTPLWQIDAGPVVESVQPARPDALPLPSSSELALAQARALVARGHLHEALRAVDDIRIDDARRPEADTLRAEIQRALLASASAWSLPGASSGTARP
jgi:hypothetical protein